jgi:polysaccharide export outer membrane protein
MVFTFSTRRCLRALATLALLALATLRVPGQNSSTLAPPPSAPVASAPQAPPDSTPDSSPDPATAAPAAPAPAVPGETPAAPAATSASYLLQNNDLIRITVFQEDDLTTETRISKNGMITLPLLGALKVAGMSVGQAQERIRYLLDKDYIINPHVNLSVLEYSKLRVTVLGEVQHPGNVEIPPEGGLDVLGAIALASGYTADADSSHINIRREVNGKEVILYVNGTELARDSNVKPFMVQSGDAITVPYIKKWITMLGEVQRPGKVDLPAEGDLDLLGALALAGGYTPDADPTHVDIRRSVDGKDTIISVNASELAHDPTVKAFIVEPGDSINVHYAKDWVTILGEVQRPGKVKIPPEGGLDLLGAIALAGGFSPNADSAHITIRRTVDNKDSLISVNAKKLSRDIQVNAFMVQPGDNISVPERMF